MAKCNLADQVIEDICRGKHPKATGLRIFVYKISKDGVHFELQAVDARNRVLTEIGTNEFEPIQEGDYLTLTNLNQLFIIKCGRGVITR